MGEMGLGNRWKVVRDKPRKKSDRKDSRANACTLDLGESERCSPWPFLPSTGSWFFRNEKEKNLVMVPR